MRMDDLAPLKAGTVPSKRGKSRSSGKIGLTIIVDTLLFQVFLANFAPLRDQLLFLGLFHQAQTAALKRLSLRAFVTTVTEENPMAAAANIGLRSMPKKGKSAPAATGMRITL